MKNYIKDNKTRLEATIKDSTELRNKSMDLEDRSRRNNLIFYNIPESTNKYETENCEDLVAAELAKCNVVLNEDPKNVFDRIHRLGTLKNNDDTQRRPRPIIACMTYYREKELLLNLGHKLKNSVMNISEDFSKPTALQ